MPSYKVGYKKPPAGIAVQAGQPLQSQGPRQAKVRNRGRDPQTCAELPGRVSSPRQGETSASHRSYDPEPWLGSAQR